MPSWLPSVEPQPSVDTFIAQAFEFQAQRLEADKQFTLELLDVWTPKPASLVPRAPSNVERVDPVEDMWQQHLLSLGGYIRAQREFSQLSQRQLATLTDLSDTYMSQLERGKHEPSLRVLRALARGLGVDPDELIRRAAGLPGRRPCAVDRAGDPRRSSPHRRPEAGAARRGQRLPLRRPLTEATAVWT